MLKSIDFPAEHVKLVLTGLITQKVLKYNNDSLDLMKGMTMPLSFEGEIFRDYQIYIENIRITSLNKLSNNDVFLNGFLYKPHFLRYMEDKGFKPDDTIIRINFRLNKTE